MSFTDVVFKEREIEEVMGMVESKERLSGEKQMNGRGEGVRGVDVCHGCRGNESQGQGRMRGLSIRGY